MPGSVLDAECSGLNQMFYCCEVFKLMGKERNKQTRRHTHRHTHTHTHIYIYSFYHVKVYEIVPMTWDLECCDC